MMRRRDDGHDILGIINFTLLFKKIIANRTRYHAFPVFLHEHIAENNVRKNNYAGEWMKLVNTLVLLKIVLTQKSL